MGDLRERHTHTQQSAAEFDKKQWANESSQATLWGWQARGTTLNKITLGERAVCRERPSCQDVHEGKGLALNRQEGDCSWTEDESSCFACVSVLVHIHPFLPLAHRKEKVHYFGRKQNLLIGINKRGDTGLPRWKTQDRPFFLFVRLWSKHVHVYIHTAYPILLYVCVSFTFASSNKRMCLLRAFFSNKGVSHTIEECVCV